MAQSLPLNKEVLHVLQVLQCNMTSMIVPVLIVFFFDDDASYLAQMRQTAVKYARNWLVGSRLEIDGLKL